MHLQNQQLLVRIAARRTRLRKAGMDGGRPSATTAMRRGDETCSVSRRAICPRKDV